MLPKLPWTNEFLKIGRGTRNHWFFIGPHWLFMFSIDYVWFRLIFIYLDLLFLMISIGFH